MEDTVSFMGSVDFVSDMSEWLGVELDQPLAAGPDRGVFVTGNRVSKISQQQEDQEDSLPGEVGEGEREL